MSVLVNNIAEVLHQASRLLYPVRCLHCGSFDVIGNRHFCSGCLDQLQWLKTGVVANPAPFDGIAAAFDYLGPQRTLVRAIKYNDMPYLAPVAAAYLAARLANLSWPWPDVIVPVPQTFLRKMSRGYNQSALIAQALSKMIGVATVNVLKRRSGGFSQASLSYDMRRELNERFFSLKRGVNLEGKKVLVVDDVVTTGSTLACCAKKLIDQKPAALYALTICRTNRVL